MLDAMQRVILETELDVENLEPIEESALSRDCDDAVHARQLVRLMITIAVAAGPPTTHQMKLVKSFSQALNVTEPAVRVLGNLSKNRMLLFRIGFARRAHVRTYFRNTKQMLGGVLSVIKALLRFRGVISEDVELAGRFRALGDLPVGTLGRVFYDHCREAELPLCGERGGFPIGAMYHDFSHVLAGYDTSPEGEIKNAAFQAGFCQGDEDFFTTLFANLIRRV